MRNKIFIYSSIIAAIFISANFISCSKPDAAQAVAETCASKNIVVSGVVTPTAGGTSTNGSIAATATGSTGFTFSINGGAFQASGTFSNLAVGSYSITAKDAAGCTGVSTIAVTASACPTIDITAVITQASSPTIANGAINATASGSTGFTYSLAGAAFQASGNFTGLAPNGYQITVKDVNGCTFAKSFTVNYTNCPTITVNTSTVPSAGPTVANGSITASATGGVVPYTYSLNGGTYQASATFGNLLPSSATVNYSVSAKDANNCATAYAPVTVGFTPCPTITLSAAVVSTDKCLNNAATGSVTASASGSIGLMYNLNNGAYQTATLFGSLAAGSYTLCVKDANGCTTTTTATVATAAAGPNFNNVKAILAANCALSGCHAGANPQNGINFTDDCTIVSKSARIKARAVDNLPSVMPPTGAISAADKQKIVDWVNAGGGHSN